MSLRALALCCCLALAHGARAAPRILTLRDAVSEAGRQSLDFAVAQAQLAAFEALVDSASGVFVPQLSLNGNFRLAADPNLNEFYLVPRDTVSTHQSQFGLGFGGKLSFGLDYQLGIGFSHTATSALGTPVSPIYRVPLSLSLSQPLLRDRGAINRYPIDAAALRAEGGKAQLDKAAVRALLDAAEAYVGLQVAQSTLQMSTLLRDYARAQLATTNDLIKAGRLAASALTQQEANVSGREQDVLSAKVGLETARAALAAAMNLGPSAELQAGDPLAPLSALTDEQAAMAAALIFDPDLRVAKRDLKLSELDVTVRENAFLPDLRLKADAQLFGQSGNPQCINGYSADGVAPCYVPKSLSGGPQDALVHVGQGRYGSLGVGLSLSVPIDWEPLRRAVEAAGLDRRGRQAVFERLEQLVKVQTQSQVRVVAGLRAQVAEAETGVKLATEGLEFAQQSFALGKGTQFELLQSQQVLAQAIERKLLALQRLELAQLRLMARTGQIAQLVVPQERSRLFTAPSAP